MGWAASDLVTALRRQVTELEADLRQRGDGDDHHARQAGVFQAWESDYDAARAAQRTAATWSQWRDDRVTQAAVAWVLEQEGVTSAIVGASRAAQLEATLAAAEFRLDDEERSALDGLWYALPRQRPEPGPVR